MFKNKDEIMKKCVESDPNTYQYATLDLKNKSIVFAMFFLERGGSFSLISKRLRINKKVGMITLKNNSNNFQYVGKNLKGDEILKKAFQQDKETLKYSNDRLRKTNIQS